MSYRPKRVSLRIPQDFAAKLQESENLDDPLIEQGKRSENDEAEYLSAASKTFELTYSVIENFCELSKAIFLKGGQACFVLFQVLLVGYLFLFAWYIILCQGIGKVIYIKSLMFPAFEISKQDFELKDINIISIYLGTVIVQTFVLLASTQKIVFKGPSFMDECLRLGTFFADSVARFVANSSRER